MKIVVIGGSGLIGSRLVSKLSAQGHEAIAASTPIGCQLPSTGEGLAAALKGASVVVDVTKLAFLGRRGGADVFSRHQPVTSSPMERPRA